MMKLRNALVVAGLVSLFSAPAFAGASLSLVGVGSDTTPSGTIGGNSITGTTGKWGFGGGALIDFALGQRVGLEVGGLFHQGHYGDSLGFDVTYNVIEVPVALKIWAAHFLYFRLGGYADIGTGSVTVTAPDGTTSSTTFAAANENSTSYGVLGGLGLRIPLGSSVALRLEGNYHLQLSNSYNSTMTASDSTASLKYNEIQALAGITIGGGMMK